MSLLGNFKRINVKYTLANRIDQVSYRRLISEVAQIHMCTITSINNAAISNDVLEVLITDDQSLFLDVEGKKNQIVIFHVSSKNFTPIFEMLYIDILLGQTPSVKMLNKLFINAVKTKKRKNIINSKIRDFVFALNSSPDNCLGILNDLSHLANPDRGIVNYLEARYFEKINNIPKSFESLVKAYSSPHSNPLYLLELILLLNQNGRPDEALDLSLKFISSYPLSYSVVELGIELGIKRGKFYLLESFFMSTGVVPESETKFLKTYNAALSVYIRYLCRKGQFLTINTYVKFLACVTSRELYWNGVLKELMLTGPLSVWKDIIAVGAIEKNMTKNFPQEFKILNEFVHFGYESALISCKNIESINDKLSNTTKDLIKRIKKMS